MIVVITLSFGLLETQGHLSNLCARALAIMEGLNMADGGSSMCMALQNVSAACTVEDQQQQQQQHSLKPPLAVRTVATITYIFFTSGS